MQAHCTCCHICHTSQKTCWTRGFVGCARCSSLICQQCIEETLREPWSDVKPEQYTCPKCEGRCPCKRCKGRPHGSPGSSAPARGGSGGGSSKKSSAKRRDLGASGGVSKRSKKSAPRRCNLVTLYERLEAFRPVLPLRFEKKSRPTNHHQHQQLLQHTPSYERLDQQRNHFAFGSDSTQPRQQAGPTVLAASSATETASDCCPSSSAPSSSPSLVIRSPEERARLRVADLRLRQERCTEFIQRAEQLLNMLYSEKELIQGQLSLSLQAIPIMNVELMKKSAAVDDHLPPVVERSSLVKILN